MSIELQVAIEADILVGELRKGISQTVLELTGNSMPVLAVTSLVDGETKSVTDDAAIVGDGLILVEVLDFDSQIVLNIVPSYEHEGKFVCAVSAEYSRSAVEVTLAACCAIWLARRSKALIQDDWEFWTSSTTIPPDELVDRIRVTSLHGLDAACKRLVGSRVIDK